MPAPNQIIRLPDFRPSDMSQPNELAKKLSELTRFIFDKDRQQINPYDIYGRVMTANTDSMVYNGSDYTLDIPRDVGTVFVEMPAASSVIFTLPESRSVEGRKVNIVIKDAGTYSVEARVASGSGNKFSTSDLTTSVTLNSFIQLQAYLTHWLILSKD